MNDHQKSQDTRQYADLAKSDFFLSLQFLSFPSTDTHTHTHICRLSIRVRFNFLQHFDQSMCCNCVAVVVVYMSCFGGFDFFNSVVVFCLLAG